MKVWDRSYLIRLKVHPWERPKFVIFELHLAVIFPISLPLNFDPSSSSSPSLDSLTVFGCSTQFGWMISV